jgi:sensor histidine kinase YesM
MINIAIKERFHSAIAYISEFFFWVISYFVLLNMFAGSSHWQKIDYIYTSIFIATIIISVTINAWLLMPEFLKKKKYVAYCVLTVFNISGVAFFNHLLFDKLIDHILPDYYFISYYSYVDLLKFFVTFVGLTTLIHLSWEWFQLQETKHRYARLEREKIEAEYRALSNQVNPHFLFNSLTVLYSLSLRNSTETSGAVLKLSDILRYVIYESATGKVSIRSEAELIQNYIDLQRHRIHPLTEVKFIIDIDNDKTPIVPMILLPLVENSFKHGAKGEVQTEGDVINFSIINNKPEESGTVEEGGIGLSNIKNRLQLIYPGRHVFEIEERDKTFSVRLTLQVA